MSSRAIDEQQILEQLPSSLQTLMTLERFHLHEAERFQVPSRDPTFDTRYFPQHCGAFRLPCFWVRREHLQIYGRDTQFSSYCESGGRVLFPVHPTSLTHYKAFLSETSARDAADEGLCIWALPTSSTRTLLAWPDGAPQKALFIKTSLHSAILGDRRLSLRKIARSIGLSRLAQECSTIPGALNCLPESMGFAPRRPPENGAIVRSIPQEIRDGRILVAPLFSLFGGAGSHVPLLLTLIERSGVPPLRFVEDVLCVPFANLWLHMALRLGLILEAHAQDLLLVTSPDLVPLGRFFYRDFEGLQVDWWLRRSHRLPTPENMPRSWCWHETYATLGYPGSQLVWYMYHVSLFGYLHLVLNPLEQSLQRWREQGVLPGPPIEPDAVTMMFSRHLLIAIEQQFGVRVPAPFNVYRSLNRFLILLLKVRREVMGAWPSSKGREPAVPRSFVAT